MFYALCCLKYYLYLVPEMDDFSKYYFYVYIDGRISGVNKDVLSTRDESFELFESLYNTNYGSIEKDGNLISIHSGGWSENEYLISELKKTFWWISFCKIEQKGGHYYFDTNEEPIKGEWEITKKYA